MSRPKTDYSQYLRAGETLETVKEGTLRKRAHDARVALQKDIGTRTFDSTEEVTKAHAREILEERGIQNQHVLETLVELATVAQQHHKLPFNAYLFSHGLKALLASREKNLEQPVPTFADEVVTGELITRTELYALYDYGFFRESLSFDEYLALRHVCKTDCFILGRDVLGKDFHEVHQNWTNFFPKFNPDALVPNYTQEQSKSWLASQSQGKKEFLLLASRNAYKSSFSIVWLISAILCLPDLRALMVAETTRLSKGFIRSLRSYFEVTNKREPSRFQQLFPEYAIPVDDGSKLTFESPMSRLSLIQSTAESTSMDSTVAGNRADIILFDDPISNLTVGNDDMRQGSIAKYDLIQKLREVGGVSTCLGTPWHPEDLYATLIERAEGNSRMAVRLDPAWVVKPGVKKDLLALEEDDVALLFPSRLSWEFLQQELHSNKKSTRFFRSQNLIQFVPEDEAEFKIHFDPDLLTRSVINIAKAPIADDVLSVDIAYSLSARADLTSIARLRFHQQPGGLKSTTVMDVEADRLRGSELAHRLVMLTRQHKPRIVLIEKGPSWESLSRDISLVGTKYGVTVPVHFVTPANVKGAKFERIKDLEFLLAAGRLKFMSGPYVDALFAELEKIDGKVSSANKKDDRADAIAQAVRFFRITISEAQPTPEETQQLNEMQLEANRQANYGRIFGQGEPYRPPEPTPMPTAPNARGSWKAMQQARSEQLRGRR